MVYPMSQENISSCKNALKINKFIVPLAFRKL